VYKTNYGTKMVSVENKQTISKKGKKWNLQEKMF
jgi:hypothetical protein